MVPRKDLLFGIFSCEIFDLQAVLFEDLDPLVKAEVIVPRVEEMSGLIALENYRRQSSVASCENNFPDGRIKVMPGVADISAADVILQKFLLSDELFFRVLRLPLKRRERLRDKERSRYRDLESSHLLTRLTADIVVELFDT